MGSVAEGDFGVVAPVSEEDGEEAAGFGLGFLDEHGAVFGVVADVVFERLVHFLLEGCALAGGDFGAEAADAVVFLGDAEVTAEIFGVDGREGQAHEFAGGVYGDVAVAELGEVNVGLEIGLEGVGGDALAHLEIVDEGVDAPGSVVADGADLVDGHFSQDEFLNVLKLVKHVDFMLFAAGGEEREGDEEREYAERC